MSKDDLDYDPTEMNPQLPKKPEVYLSEDSEGNICISNISCTDDLYDSNHIALGEFRGGRRAFVCGTRQILTNAGMHVIQE